MINFKKILIFSTFVFMFSSLGAQDNRKNLQVLDIFNAGQPQSIILKLYDKESSVVCYVLMPENAGRKDINNSWIYDGNNIGSISCIKIDDRVSPSR